MPAKVSPPPTGSQEAWPLLSLSQEGGGDEKDGEEEEEDKEEDKKEEEAPTQGGSQEARQQSSPAMASDFESWYLRRVTAEFAEDLDKVRSAGDFKESSVPILIRALEQGSGMFTQEEKARIMVGGTEA